MSINIRLIFRSGAWIVLPSYMMYVMGAEILEGLDSAAGNTSDSKTAAIKNE